MFNKNELYLFVAKVCFILLFSISIIYILFNGNVLDVNSLEVLVKVVSIVSSRQPEPECSPC